MSQVDTTLHDEKELSQEDNTEKLSNSPITISQESTQNVVSSDENASTLSETSANSCTLQEQNPGNSTYNSDGEKSSLITNPDGDDLSVSKEITGFPVLFKEQAIRKGGLLTFHFVERRKLTLR